MSDIKEKIEMELKPLETVCEKALENLKYALECPECKSAEEIMYLAKAHSAIVDSKKDIVEMCYKKQILEAMEESEYDVDYDENGPRFYRGQRRNSKGQFMPRMYEERMMPDVERMRDIDRDSRHVMYYSDNGMTNGMNGTMRNGNYENSGEMTRTGKAMRHYKETKEMHNSNTAEDKEKKMKAENEFLDAFREESMEMMRDASPEERTMFKKKLMNLSEQI